MATQADELLKAYELSQRDKKAPFDPTVGTKKEYEVSADQRKPGMASALTVDPRLKPGQKFGQRGTTIYNPSRSSKEVEAVKGEARYNPRVEENSSDAMNIRIKEQDIQIKELTAQLGGLIAGLTVGKQVEPTVTISIPESTPIMPDYKDMQYSELKKVAAGQGLSAKGTKSELIARLMEADSKDATGSA